MKYHPSLVFVRLKLRGILAPTHGQTMRYVNSIFYNKYIYYTYMDRGLDIYCLMQRTYIQRWE